MATAPRPRARREIDYPTSDGKPMAETELHRDLLIDTIKILQRRYADDPMVCVSGNLLMYYEEGNKRRHVSPDVFVSFGIEKQTRDYYLVWAEGKGPDVVIELTSKSTSEVDETTKRDLYRDILRVPEYFLFDPTQDYLDPPLKGYRLIGGLYEDIEPIDGRLPSNLLGLHLERDGTQLRFHDPAYGRWLATPEEENERLRREVEELRRRLGEGG